MKITRSQKVKTGLFGEESLEAMYPKNRKLMSHDNIGKKFGRLTVLYPIENSTPTTYWMCQCKCGEYFIASSSFLSSESVPNCGCLKKNSSKKKGKASNVHFVFEDGILIMEKPSDSIKIEEPKKESKLKGSFGERLIHQILEDNNIPFEREWRVTLPDGSQGRFDFYVNKSYYIEYDGEQHTKVVQAWDGLEGLEKRLEKDSLKNEYCMIGRIPLIRIPYTVKDVTLDMLRLETSIYVTYGGEEISPDDIYFLCHEKI